MNHRILAVAALAFFTSTGAQAGLTFDTVTGLIPAHASGAGSDGSNYMATSFAVAGTPNFNSISFLLAADAPADGGSVVVYLVPDDGSGGAWGVAGAPDFSSAITIGSIADSSLADISGGTPTLITLTGVPNTVTTPNGEYWVALDTATLSSSAEWVYNIDDSGVGTANQSSYSDVNGQYPDTGSLPPGGAFAMIVDAPEPTTLALLGGGLAALGYVRRRGTS